MKAHDPHVHLDELRRAVEHERDCVVLHALHVGCGAMALAAMGVDQKTIDEALNAPAMRGES